jgi:putative ABC transport system permease protein
MLSSLAVTSLAIGISAVVSTYALIDAVDIRALPYRAPERLVAVHMASPGKAACTACLTAPTLADFVHWRTRLAAFSDLAAFQGVRRTRFSDGNSEPMWIASVSSNLLSLLGTQPVRGRFFSFDEERPGQDHVIVLSNTYWRDRFAADSNAVGQTMLLGSGIPGSAPEPYTIIGILPDDFAIPPGMSAWAPLNASAEVADEVGVIGRVAEGTTLQQAAAGLSTIPITSAGPNPEKLTPVVQSLRSSLIQYDAQLGSGRFVLLGAVAMLLVLTLANLVSLLSAQNAAREDDLAIRAALGASPARLLSQPFLEAAALIVVSGVLGLGLARFAMPALARQLGASEVGVRIALDARGMLIGLAIWTVCLMVVWLGLWRQIAVVGRAPSASFAARGPRRQSLKRQTTILVLETGIAFFAVATAGLLGREFDWVRNRAPGYSATGLSSLSLRDLAPATGVDELLAPFSQPAGSGMAAADAMESEEAEYHLDASKAPLTSAELPFRALVSAGYFQTLRIPLVAGRLLGPDDRIGSPNVAVVNRVAASRLWPGENPIGKIISINKAGGPSRRVEIVGVVENAKVFVILGGPSQPVMYRPIEQVGARLQTLFVRLDGSDADAARRIRMATAAFFPQPIRTSEVKSMSGYLDRETRVPRFNARALAGVSVIMMMLAALGMYGLTMHTVLARGREIATRTALGASTRHVVLLVLKRTIQCSIAGLSIGGLAFFASRSVISSLFGLSVDADYRLLMLGALILGVTALTATFVPLRRALSIEPAHVLR